MTFVQLVSEKASLPRSMNLPYNQPAFLDFRYFPLIRSRLIQYTPRLIFHTQLLTDRQNLLLYLLVSKLFLTFLFNFKAVQELESDCLSFKMACLVL